MKLIISILIPLLVGGLSGFITKEGVNTWYSIANKPSFNPPNWVFGPVWTTLYILMGFALYLIWQITENTSTKKNAIALFTLQLALNFFWSIIFFKYQATGWALVEIAAMWLAILFTIIYFRKLNKTAAWLLVPYLCWVSFAAVLNYSIWSLN